MDKFKLLQSLTQANNSDGPSEQDLAIEKVRRSQLNPEQRMFEDAQLKALSRQPMQQAQPTATSPQEAAMLDQKAKEARQRFDALSAAANAPMSLDQLDQINGQASPQQEQQKFQNIRNLVKK